MQGDAKGSLKIEKMWWTYREFAEHSGVPQSTLEKYVSWHVFRFGREYGKRGKRVEFHPGKAMERLDFIRRNPDVLRQAKKNMASETARRKSAKDAELRERA